MKKPTNTFHHLRIRLQLKLYQIRMETLVYGLCLLYSIIIGQFVPALVLLLSFNLIRPATPLTFHFNNVYTCIKVSICMFVVSITQLGILPQNITICSGIVLGLIICLVLYKIEYHRINSFDFNHCTKEDVIQVCNDLGYKKDKQELAIMFFVDKLTNKQVWEILCKTQRNVEWDTVKHYRYMIKRDFKRIIDLEDKE